MWREHPSIPGLLVSSDGRVARLIAQADNGIGYKKVTIPARLRKYQAWKSQAYVHRLVAETFLDGDAKGRLVNHINNNPADNRAENLEYVDHSGNIQHAYDTGRRKGAGRKLTDEQVRKIRSLVDLPIQGIADRYGIQLSAAWKVVRGHTYQEVM